MKSCPSCGGVVEADSATCKHCDASFLKTCPFCAEQIQPQAVVCKHCGRELPASTVVAPIQAVSVTPQAARKRSRGFVGKLILGLLALSVLGYVMERVTDPTDPASASPKFTEAQKAKLEKDIDFLRTSGMLVRFDVANNEAQINPLLWGGVNADAKRGVVTALSQYCDMRGSSARLKVVDAQSGREVAEFSSWSGVTIK